MAENDEFVALLGTPGFHYDMQGMSKWDMLRESAGCIWTRRSLWQMMGQLFLIMVSICGVCLLTQSNPHALRVSKFYRVAKMLTIFVGFLIGFFVTSSINRWNDCAAGFMELFDAIRNMQMQLCALGVPEDRGALCLRYGVLSAWHLNVELKAEVLEKEPREAYLRHAWGDIVRADVGATSSGASKEEGRPLASGNQKLMAYMLPGEGELLRRVVDPSSQLWLWVGSLIGRMAQDGQIPAMVTPTYGRLIELAEDAHSAIRKVRSSISVQTPFVYSHLLACLVHFNNILNAVCFGCVLGVSVGTCIQHAHETNFYTEGATAGEMRRDIQEIVITLVICLTGPFLYQALLEVGVCISRPFGDHQGRMPMDRLIDALEQDLRGGRFLAAHVPCWEAPAFQSKA